LHFYYSPKDIKIWIKAGKDSTKIGVNTQGQTAIKYPQNEILHAKKTNLKK
jgi:hypothetical protein